MFGIETEGTVMEGSFIDVKFDRDKRMNAPKERPKAARKINSSFLNNGIRGIENELLFEIAFGALLRS
jgi:hypothetical protein